MPTDQEKQNKKRAFYLSTTASDKVKFEEDELFKVREGMKNKNTVKLKQGEVRGCYIVGIFEDNEREVYREHFISTTGKRISKFKPLKNIFNEE